MELCAGISRRTALLGLGVAGFGLSMKPVAGGVFAQYQPVSIDKNDRMDNLRAYLKIISDLSGKPTFRFHTGTILHVPEPKRMGIPFLNFIAIKQDRVRQIDEGTYQHGYRGIIMFADPHTGDIIDTFDNPNTGENVAVKHYKTSRGSIVYAPEGQYVTSVGRAPGKTRPETDHPFRLDWGGVGDDAWVTYDERFEVVGSDGNVVAADSSMYRYRAGMRQISNPAVTSADMTMSWSTETGYWDWMNMSEQPGHLIFGSIGTKYADLSGVPASLLEQIEERLPGHLTESITWSEYTLK